MDENLRAQIETQLQHLEGLVRHGRQIRDDLPNDPSNASVMAAARAWQEHCGATINQLSGGSKAHWLARSFSEAFLMRSVDGRAVAGAAPAEIVNRLLNVLEQAVASLSGMIDGPGVSGYPPSSSSSEAPAPRRFEFVHNSDLKPVLERAYSDSRHALELQDYDLALRTSCGILEAIVTDALEYHGQMALTVAGAPAGMIGDWPFDTRLEIAERTGLIRGGCARLPAVARTYRDHSDAGGDGGPKTMISERDARRAGQVLHVVMRDLDPGR
jgi:hypothetical protein